MPFVVIGVLAVLVFAVLYLYDRNADARWRLKMAEQDAARWKEEAVKRGWKNPFEEIIDSLKASTEKLQAVAAQMRRTAEAQRQNAAALAEMNRKLRAANASMAAANARLDKAAGHFASSRKLLPEPRPARSAERDPAVDEAVRKAEADIVAGRIETDPLKRN